jgi:hypothetical protein
MKQLKIAAIAWVVLFITALVLTAQTTVNGRKDGFNCVVPVSTATTLTAACSAIAGNRAMYITDIEFGSSVASSTAADSFPTLKFGTGTTCGTGTTVFWQAMTAANTTAVTTLTTPIKVPKGNDVCFIHSVAGSKTVQIHGFFGDTE